MVDETKILSFENKRLWDTHSFNEEWYYEKVKRLAYNYNNINTKNKIKSNCNNNEIYLTIDDFLFRYDRGAFWMARPVIIILTIILIIITVKLIKR